MVEKATRRRGGDQPRGGTESEWEVFVREETADPLRHVGSVTAPTADVAHEQATRLFAWYADGVWVCPAEEVVRFETHDLDAEATPVEAGADDEDRTLEG